MEKEGQRVMGSDIEVTYEIKPGMKLGEVEIACKKADMTIRIMDTKKPGRLHYRGIKQPYSGFDTLHEVKPNEDEVWRSEIDIQKIKVRFIQRKDKTRIYTFCIG